MSTGPVVPGNRVYPGTSQHWTSGQIVDSRDLVKSAALISVGLLAFVLAVIVITALWH